MDPSVIREMARAQHGATARLLDGAANRREAVFQAVAEAHGWFDRLRRKFRTVERVACTRGCAGCCRQRVSLSPGEAFRIARHLDTAPLPAPTLARITAEISQRWAQEDRWSSPRRFASGLPCPFVDPADDACLIHPLRPFACRWFESMDADACRSPLPLDASGMDIPCDPRVQTLAEAVEQGLLSGLAAHGLRGGALVMTGALTAIRRDPHSLDRWLAGENPFPVETMVTAAPCAGGINPGD